MIPDTKTELKLWHRLAFWDRCYFVGASDMCQIFEAVSKAASMLEATIARRYMHCKCVLQSPGFAHILCMNLLLEILPKLAR